MGPTAPEATVNFLVALAEFNDDDGATLVIPGSHKWPDISVMGNHEDAIPKVPSSLNGRLYLTGRAASRPALDDFYRQLSSYP
jgi:ectoine hydroxylase-related dioxygenase (phytanoyl-CoA dioxygenase family)